MSVSAPSPFPRFVRSSDLRLFILLYVLLYAAFGVASPFWPRYFETRGITPEQIGALIGLSTFIRLVSGPFAGRIADRFQELRGVLAATAVVAACFALALAWSSGFWGLLVIQLCLAAALAPTVPLADALALGSSNSRRVDRRGFEYGWVRGSASIAFIVGTVIAGQALNWTEISVIVWMHAALLLAAAFSAMLVPVSYHDTTAASEPSSFSAVTDLLGIVVLRRMLLVAALVYGSHALHDTFAVIWWNDVGISSAIIGVLWAEAVAAEVVVFILIGPQVINSVGPGGAAAIAVLAAVIRWVVMASSTSIVAFAMVQPLHGLTFALLHLACMRLMGNCVPQHLAATAQALYALGPGIATAALTLLSGFFYARFGSTAFLLMALIAAVALPLCPSLQRMASSPTRRRNLR